MNELIHKHFTSAQIKSADGDQGVIEAIVSVFNNVDFADEMIVPGCFSKSIANKLPKGVWGHDWLAPVSKTLEAKELLPGDPLLPLALHDLGGLYIKAQFNLDTQRGKEAYSDVKFGIIDEFSIGFLVTKERTDPKTGIRYLMEGELYEWSPVLVGMNPATQLISIKGGTMQPNNKGQFLGGGVEQAMTMTALCALNDRLYSVIYNCLNSTDALPDRLTVLEGACNEFTATLLTTVRVLMQNADTAESAAVEIYSLGLAVDATTPVLGSRVERTVKAASDALLADARGHIERIKAIGAMRLKEGRTISAATAAKLKPHAANMRAAADELDAMCMSDDEPDEPDAITIDSKAAIMRLTAMLLGQQLDVLEYRIM